MNRRFFLKATGLTSFLATGLIAVSNLFAGKHSEPRDTSGNEKIRMMKRIADSAGPLIMPIVYKDGAPCYVYGFDGRISEVGWK